MRGGTGAFGADEVEEDEEIYLGMGLSCFSNELVPQPQRRLPDSRLVRGARGP
jgi:hypothetical protein